MRALARAEWPTIGLLVACYLLWAVGITVAVLASLPLAIVVTGTACALHSSLSHEVVHGHPTDNPRLNAMLVWPQLSVAVPYGRFRDTHLAHHTDARLTDPYDDPESNYLDPAVWVRLPRWMRALLRANNTLLGRMTLGPLLGQAAFLKGDIDAIRAGDAEVAGAWRAHVAPVFLVVGLVALSPMPLWSYLISVYIGLSLLRIRTFLEHRAHEHTAARTVVIEDRGPLALLYLNNNFHVVHHMHPDVPWYRLPALYASNVERYLRRNEGYRYRSYTEVFARHLLRAKDPVPHPLWPQPDALTPAEPPQATQVPAFAVAQVRDDTRP